MALWGWGVDVSCWVAGFAAVSGAEPDAVPEAVPDADLVAGAELSSVMACRAVASKCGSVGARLRLWLRCASLHFETLRVSK